MARIASTEGAIAAVIVVLPGDRLASVQVAGVAIIAPGAPL